MSKVATYLQGHITGHVLTRKDVCEKYADTLSVLSATPEMVVCPRSTNDIRKLVRFAWQLAEKGHSFGISTRGGGTDPTASSLTHGALLSMTPSMSTLYEYEPKQHLLRAQPGATVATAQSALSLHGVKLPIPAEYPQATLGGAIANGELVDGSAAWVHQLEVVVDSGDVIQTGRISKHDFNKKSGKQGREGDIYRGIDTVLEDHAELIATLQKSDMHDRSGYPGITQVRGRGGSFDLTPLFVGSQGTLGIISEMIVEARFAPRERVYAAAYFANSEIARDALDQFEKQSPALLEYIDGAFVAEALDQGNIYPWLKLSDAQARQVAAGTLIVIGFDEFNDRKRSRSLSKLRKKLDKLDCIYTTSTESDIETLRRVVDYTALPAAHADRAAPEIVPGFYVPRARFEDFLVNLAKLADSLHVDIPLHGDIKSGRYSVRPTFSLQRVADKQKLFKLIDSLNALIVEHGGALVAHGGEGRLLSRFVRADWSDEYEKMVDEIKAVFDPHGMLNLGVKQPVELRELVAELRSDNSSNATL